MASLLPFEVFLQIAFYVDDVATFRSLREVCHAAKRACEHLKPWKKDQFSLLYIGKEKYVKACSVRLLYLKSTTDGTNGQFMMQIKLVSELELQDSV
jgi:hypothetical protein